MTLPTIIKGKSISEWAEHFNVSPGVIYTRIRNGRSAGSVIGELLRNGTEDFFERKPAKSYTCNDQTMTLAEWSKQTGIGIRTLRYRLAHGWTLERALTEPPGTTLGTNSHRPKAEPGVVADFSNDLGTGGGRHA